MNLRTPNKGVQATVASVRSYLASASSARLSASVRSLQKTSLDASPGMTYGNTYCRELCSMIKGMRGGA